VLNTNTPLTPAVPAFDVDIHTDPLLVFEPYPDNNDTTPPEVEVDSPAVMTIFPPTPLSPDPTVTDIEPP
jgi:hypothetical protein